MDDRRRLHAHDGRQPRRRPRAEPRTERRAAHRGRAGVPLADLRGHLRRSTPRTFRLQRRIVKGIGGSLTYTLAKSMDDASNNGGGGTVVAQNDQDLAAEYSLSSFDRRHQVIGNASVELPFGPNKPWFNSGGFWGTVLGGWRGSADFTWQSGTPLTPRVVAAARDVSSGVSGTLRADVVPGVAVFPSGLSYPQYLQSAGVRRAGGRRLRRRGPQPDHRPRQQAAQRAVLARRADEGQPRRHAAAPPFPTCSTSSTTRRSTRTCARLPSARC